MIGDVYIDQRDILDDCFNMYGDTNYVYRINEDDTLDVCFSSCYAWKANGVAFNSTTSELVRRNGKLQNPLYDEKIVVE